MAGRTVALLTALLWMLTACRQDEVSQPQSAAALAPVPDPPHFETGPEPGASCYSFILLRPKDQRAIAVQARLKKADELAAAFRRSKLTVDLMGDHANVLSLQFPAVWPAEPAYAERVSSIVEDYLTTPDVQDYMCNSGFDEVRLSARGLKDRRVHPLW